MSPPTLRLLKTLLENGLEGTHRENLMRQAEMSSATFYRGLEPLLKMGVIQENKGHYTLPLSHPYNFAFKLWHDQEMLLELEPRLRDEVADLIKKIQLELGENLLALWVHGSVAQQTMSPESDVDFLAVVRDAQEIDVIGSRSVQLTVLTNKEFQEDYQAGDNFIRTVLTYGLLVFDRNFASPFYERPCPAPASGTLQERQTMQERIRSRLLFFIKEESVEDGRKALSSLSVIIGRSMLEELGELPAGKADLVASLKLYFGSEFSDLVAKCLAQTVELDELYPSQQTLLEEQERFAVNASHLKGLATAMSGSSQVFENACEQMLPVLFPEGKIRRGESLDWQVQTDKGEIGVCCKSVKGSYTLQQLSVLPAYRPLVLIVNQLREVPITKRPQLSQQFLEAARDAGVQVVDSRELLQKAIVGRTEPVDVGL